MNEFGYEEEVTENIYATGEDFSGGAELSEKYIAIQWFTGIKTYLIGADDKYVLSGEGERRNAKGMSIPLQWAKNDELLMSVLNKMVKAKTCVIQVVEHSGEDKDRQKYAFLNDWSFIPLSLNAINHKVAVAKPAKISGYATGVTINEKTAYKETYVSMLILVKSLVEAGYVDDEGNPKPLLCTMKSFNGGDVDKIMQSAVKRQMVYRAFDIPGLNSLRGKRDGKIVRGGEELFEYWIRMGTSAERKDRGSEPNVTSCFVAVDLDADPALWTPAFEKKQWIGEELYRKVFKMVYTIKDKERIPGGISWEHATKTLAKHSEICRRLDPEGVLKMGKNEVPVQWKLQEEINRKRALTQAVQGEVALTPAEAAVAKYQNSINTYREMFFADEEGSRLVDEAQSHLNNPASGRGTRVGAAMQALKDYAESSSAISDF